MRQIFFFIVAFLFIISIFIAGYNKHILLAPGDNSARFISQIVPSEMEAGQPYQISITLENNGITSWTREQNYRLGQQASGSNYFGLSRILLDQSEQILPGQTKTFTFMVSAPQQEGTYIFQARMVQELIEWFGETTPEVQINVVDNRLWDWGNAEPEPSIAWISRGSTGMAVWLSNRPDDSTVPQIGQACPNGFGTTNSYLMQSKLNQDGTVSRKTAAGNNCLAGDYNDLVPWGDTPDLHEFYPEGQQDGNIIPAHWGISKSAGLFTSPVTGYGMEEYHPYPATIVLPQNVIPDGNEHILQGCYLDYVYINENGFNGEACYDATCLIGNCPGTNRIINTKYRVYDYCEIDKCYANGEVIDSPIYFFTRLDYVLRVSYTLVSGSCTGSPVLTEEQWYAEGIGFVGFSNDDFLSPAPNAVDFVSVYEQTQCIPYWDGLCSADPRNYNDCCPAGHANCNVYRQDMVLPAVTLASPLEGELVQGTKEIVADATDNVGITKVEFYVNNYLIGTSTNFPYSTSWNTAQITNGEKKITARAYDADENYITTSITRVSVSNTALDSDFYSQHIPTEMNVGQKYLVNITFKNIGLNSWIINDYYLSAQNNYWGIQRVDFEGNEVIDNGEYKTFIFNVTAPITSGNYLFSWRIKNNNTEFGDLNSNFVISVINPQTSGTTTSGGSSGGGSGGGSSSGGIRPLPGASGGAGTTAGGSSGVLPEQSTQIEVEEPSVLETSEKNYELKLIYWSAFTILIASIIFALVKIGKLLKIRMANSPDLAFKELALRSQNLDSAFNNKTNS